jgi:putative ABC transport system ATP-binding protein
MITINNLTKKFGNNFIFNNLNLQVKKGEMVALWGESGCGKTTLLNIIGLLDTEFKGDLAINGKLISKTNISLISKTIRENIVYLFQNYALIDDKIIFYNLDLAYFDKTPKNIRIQNIKQILKSVGLNLDLNVEVFKLSGGEQQRLSIARALLLDREIYLCDEPTGNLDQHNRDIVLDLLEMIHQAGKTIVIVTHDQFVASKCDRVIDIVKIRNA